jgi:hypothetical protein
MTRPTKRRKANNVVRLVVVPKAEENKAVDQKTVDALYQLYRQALEGKIIGLIYHVIHPDERYSNGVTGLITEHPEHGVYGAARLLHLCNRALDARKT